MKLSLLTFNTIDRHNPCSSYLPTLLPQLTRQTWTYILCILWWKRHTWSVLSECSQSDRKGRRQANTQVNRRPGGVLWRKQTGNRSGDGSTYWENEDGEEPGKEVKGPSPNVSSRDVKWVVRYTSLLLKGELWPRGWKSILLAFQALKFLFFFFF